MIYTTQDAQMIENFLNDILIHISSNMTAEDRLQIRKYINAGENALALDELASTVVELRDPVAPDLRGLFNAAAKKMGIEPGTGWSGIDDLLNTGYGRSLPSRVDRRTAND